MTREIPNRIESSMQETYGGLGPISNSLKHNNDPALQEARNVYAEGIRRGYRDLDARWGADMTRKQHLHDHGR